MKFQELFHGCLEVVETENGYFPVRFTPGQLWVYGEDPNLKIRSLCTAGVFLEFETDAGEVFFAYHALLFARPYIAFDIYENGVLTETVRCPDNSASGEVVYRRRSRGPSKLRIYLPNTAQIVVRDFFAGDCRPVPRKAGKKLLFLGDSITQGMVAESPSLTYTSQLSRCFDADALNQGVGGERFRAETLDSLPGFRPDLILVAYGTNDSTQPESAEEIGRNISAYFQRLRGIFPSPKVAAVTPVWRAECADDPQYEEKLCRISDAVVRSALQTDCAAVDGMSLVPHMARYYQDGIHPNDIGFSQYAIHLIREIRDLL